MIEIPPLSDMHVHLRHGDLLKKVLPHTTRTCGRALLMPNIGQEGLITPSMVTAYQKEVGYNPDTEWLWTFKLTEETRPEQIKEFRQFGCVAGKLYPDGVTTNSKSGLGASFLREPRKHKQFMDVLAEMAENEIVLSIHGEMPGVFCLDREQAFIDAFRNSGLLNQIPTLRVVLEHITTSEAVDFIANVYNIYPNRIAATITLHHMLLTLDDVCGDKLHPHNFCKPIAKREVDRLALIRAATSYCGCFFLGSDSAPHVVDQKECTSGCAGCFTAPILAEGLAMVFSWYGRLDRLADFTSRKGDRFYRLPPVPGKLILKQEPWQVPYSYDNIVPFAGSNTFDWKLVARNH